MKSLITSSVLLLFICLFSSCSEENFEIIEDQEIPIAPVVIDIDNSVSYRLTNTSTVKNTGGRAYKYPATLPNSANYFVASDDVSVVCEDNGGFSSSFMGGDLFQFLFYSDESGSYVLFGDFAADINGELVTASSAILPFDCPKEPIVVDFSESNGRLQGTFTGEFFKLATDLVSPFDSCVNYVSLGILDASFDLELIDCN